MIQLRVFQNKKLSKDDGIELTSWPATKIKAYQSAKVPVFGWWNTQGHLQSIWKMYSGLNHSSVRLESWNESNESLTGTLKSFSKPIFKAKSTQKYVVTRSIRTWTSHLPSKSKPEPHLVQFQWVRYRNWSLLRLYPVRRKSSLGLMMRWMTLCANYLMGHSVVLELIQSRTFKQSIEELWMDSENLPNGLKLLR